MGSFESRLTWTWFSGPWGWGLRPGATPIWPQDHPVCWPRWEYLHLGSAAGNEHTALLQHGTATLSTIAPQRRRDGKQFSDCSVEQSLNRWSQIFYLIHHNESDCLRLRRNSCNCDLLWGLKQSETFLQRNVVKRVKKSLNPCLSPRSRARVTALFSTVNSHRTGSASPALTLMDIFSSLASAAPSPMRRQGDTCCMHDTAETSGRSYLICFCPHSFQTRFSSTQTTGRWSGTPTALCWMSRPSRRHISCPLPFWWTWMETLIHQGRVDLLDVSLHEFSPPSRTAGFLYSLCICWSAVCSVVWCCNTSLLDLQVPASRPRTWEHCCWTSGSSAGICSDQ